jgi:hypothetical protein
VADRKPKAKPAKSLEQTPWDAADKMRGHLEAGCLPLRQSRPSAVPASVSIAPRFATYAK